MKKMFTFIGLLFCCAFGANNPPVAASNTISSPFETGTSWYICQGYNGPVSHSGIYALSLDFTKNLCDGGQVSNSSSAGAPVRAPLGGVVYWYSAAYGSLCINTNDRRSVGLTHINSSLKPGDTVRQNQQIGTIGSMGTLGNGGIAHLHIQMWNASNCNSNPIPFSMANNARICGAPDMPVVGPDNYRNGTWSGTKITAQSCSAISQASTGSVYRFWSDKYQRHFYTSQHEEAQSVADTWPETWRYEGIAFRSDVACSGSQIHRFWSNKYNGHFYTASVDEKNHIVSTWPDVWKYEGVAYCSASQNTSGSKPVYRFWSNTKQSHFYTANEAEKNNVIATWPDIWTYEGVAYYVF